MNMDIGGENPEIVRSPESSVPGAEPVYSEMDGDLKFYWQGRNYDARYARTEDIVHILEGVTQSLDQEERAKSTELGNKLSQAEDGEAVKAAQAEMEDQEAKSKNISEGGFRQLRNFLNDLIGNNQTAPSTHTPHLFVINRESLDRITRLNKADLNNSEESPVLTSQENFFDRSNGYALSRENGEKLKKVVKDCETARFKINHEFDDGFVLNIDGREIAFFTIPKEQGKFEVGGNSGEKVDEEKKV